MTLTPAYGRDYKSAKDAKAGFFAGHDFIIADIFHEATGRYCNLQDLRGEVKQVTVRFDRLRKLTVIKVPEVS